MNLALPPRRALGITLTALLQTCGQMLGGLGRRPARRRVGCMASTYLRKAPAVIWSQPRRDTISSTCWLHGDRTLGCGMGIRIVGSPQGGGGPQGAAALARGATAAADRHEERRTHEHLPERASGDAAEMQRRCSGGRCRRGAAEVQGRCRGGAGEVQRRCSGGAGEVQPGEVQGRCCGRSAETCRRCGDTYSE